MLADTGGVAAGFSLANEIGRDTLITASGWGGQPYENLKKGTPTYDHTIYGVTRGKALADAAGRGFRVDMIDWRQGENNEGDTSAQSRIGRPGAIMQRTMTDAENIAFGGSEIDLCVDASEIAQEFGGLVLRDRAAGRPISVTSGTMASLNSKPAVNFNDTGYMRATYQVPASYFMACALKLDTLTSTAAFVSSADTADDRLFWGALHTTGNMRLDHGTAGSIDTNVGSLIGTHVLWATYDAQSNAAAIGIDAMTAAGSATFTGTHKGAAATNIFGGATTWPMDGLSQTCIIGDRYLGGDDNYATRAALLAWLAETSGVSLGV